MRKLCFKWVLHETVSCMEEVTQEKIDNQKQKLETMLLQLREKLSNLVGVNISSYRHISCSGKYVPVDGNSSTSAVYSVNNRMEIIIDKTGRKTTKYEFI